MRPPGFSYTGLGDVCRVCLSRVDAAMRPPGFSYTGPGDVCTAPLTSLGVAVAKAHMPAGAAEGGHGAGRNGVEESTSPGRHCIRRIFQSGVKHCALLAATNPRLLAARINWSASMTRSHP